MTNKSTINENDEVEECTNNCESKVIEAETLNECESKCYTPMGCTGPVIVKIPVVLSHVEIQIDVEAVIKLSKEAFDVKTIDKHIFLTQCKLIPHTDKLFIAGYIQKNIQFSTIDCADKNSLNGKIQHTTANVSFNCVTKIKLFKKPLFGKEYKKRFNVLDKNMLGIDTREDSWIHYSRFNEDVFCELESAKIAETDIFNKLVPREDTLEGDKGFREIEEKMVINVKLKVLQNQKVFIPSYEGDLEILEDQPTNNAHIEIGYDHERGIIGREVSDYDFKED